MGQSKSTVHQVTTVEHHQQAILRFVPFHEQLILHEVCRLLNDDVDACNDTEKLKTVAYIDVNIAQHMFTPDKYVFVWCLYVSLL